MNTTHRILAILTIIIATVGCSNSNFQSASPLNESDNYYNYIQPTYAQYLQESRVWLSKNRTYISEQHELELAMNMPFELSPVAPTDKAILLVHGLGDSPYSFSDLANTMRKQGFHVQALLLPGHGSKPSDLMLPNYSDWQQIVDHYANLLKQEYKHVWLGGFSTGGNLVTIHAIEQGNIDGLLLLSPGFQSRTPILEKLAPFASLFFDGYESQENNIARYTSAPINGAIAYSDSASKLRGLLQDHQVTIATLIAISEADSIIDPEAVSELYQEHFTNPNNQLVWYGEKPTKGSSIHSLPMHLDKLKISTGSHMSPIFSPTNRYYGKHGEKRMCMNSFSDEATEYCSNGGDVWYSAWGYEEEGKVHARLTWNPYYKDLEQRIHHIIESNGDTGR